MEIRILDGEFWYGGAVEDSKFMPIGVESHYAIDLTINKTYNQASAVFFSSKGRYFCSESGFNVLVDNGVIALNGGSDPIIFDEGHTDLAGAYQDFAKKYLKISGNMPNKLMFERPQYCTWIELKYEQSQDGVLKYAESIIKSGMPSGEIIIDDCWQVDYGDWRFNPITFPNPKEMTRRLNEMGFEVILWICPYVSPDSYITREILSKNDMLVKLPNGELSIHHWWNGYSAMLDMSNSQTIKWLNSQLDFLRREYNIKGFKMDAGDAFFHNADEITCGNLTPNASVSAWADFARGGEFCELRASFNNGGLGVTQRLCDKFHTWDIDNGLKCLIPSATICSLLGHSFLCPDMIGGGLWTNFLVGEPIDEELLIRWVEVSALMPMMQFSYAIWEHASDMARKICIKYSNLHMEMSKYILALAKRARENATPLIRSMEFQFPNCGYEAEQTMFMLGDKYLVAPILEKGVSYRQVKLPKGQWRYCDGIEYNGNQLVSVKADIETLPYFEKI